MKKLFTMLGFWILCSVIVVVISITSDWGKEHWCWFQRSGSILVLIGGILTYRSIFRLGIKGFGGDNIFCYRARVAEPGDDGVCKVVRDDETQQRLAEVKLDKRAGLVGVILIIFGTLVWGYGDLLGLLVQAHKTDVIAN